MPKLFGEVVKQEGYIKAPPETKRQIASDFFAEVVTSQEGYKKAPTSTKSQIWQDFTTQYDIPQVKPAPALNAVPPAAPVVGATPPPVDLTQEAFGEVQNVSMPQGLANLGGAIGGGLGDFGKAAVDPRTYQQIMGQVQKSFQTEGQNLGNWGEIPAALGLGAAQGARDLGQGLSSLPADIVNAYLGQQAYSPMVNLPSLPQGAEAIMQRHPVSSFIGEQVPYAIPLGRAAQGAKAAKVAKVGQAAAEGAAIGASIDPNGQGIRGRATTAAMGATVPAALGSAGGALSKSVKMKPLKAAEMKRIIQERLNQVREPERPIGLAPFRKDVQARIVPKEAPVSVPQEVIPYESKAKAEQQDGPSHAPRQEEAQQQAPSEGVVDGQGQAEEVGTLKASAQKSKTLSKTAVKKAEMQDIKQTLDVLLRHPDFSERPAADTLGELGIPYRKVKKGEVLHYRVMVPRKGAVLFKYNATISGLVKKIGPDTFSAMIHGKQGADFLLRETKGLSDAGDNFDGDLSEVGAVYERRGIEEYKQREAEEEAHMGWVEGEVDSVFRGLDGAKTDKELRAFIERGYSDKMSDAPESYWEDLGNKIKEVEERLSKDAKIQERGLPEPNAGNPRQAEPAKAGGQSQSGSGTREAGQAGEGFSGTAKGLSQQDRLGGVKQGLLSSEFAKDEQASLDLFGSASAKQAQEAADIKKARQKTDRGGFMRIGGKAQKPKPKASFNAKAKGVSDLVGSTRTDPTIQEKIADWHKSLFVYMHKVKDKTFDVGGVKKDGNRFVAEVDRLKSALNTGYADADLKIKNAMEGLDDSPGYSAQDKIKDVTQYLLYSDFIRRAQDGMPVPYGLTMKELQDGYRAITAHVRQNADVRKAALNIRGLLSEIGDDLVKAGVIEKTRKQYFPHQVLEHLRDTYGLPVRVQTPNRGYAKSAKGSVKEIETDLLKALDSHLKAITRHNAIDDFIKRVTDEYSDPNWKLGNPLPQGFTEFQPRSGRQHFMAFSVPEQAVSQAVWEKLNGDPNPEVRAYLQKVKQVLAVGSPRKTYAMPEEVVGYLNKLYEPRYLEGANTLANKAVNAWKAIVTASPLNPAVVAFHFKNAIGDMEAGLRDDPNLYKYVRRSIVEIAKSKKSPSQDMLSAKEWGTIGAGYYGAELHIKDDFHFKRRFSGSLKDRVLTRTPILSQAYRTYKKWEELIATKSAAREDILRYAKYLKDTDLGLEPWQAHIENGKTFVNYNHLTRFERDVLRDTLLPFYTFYKSNAVNWFESLTGQRGLGTAARGVALAAVFPMAASIWNQMTDPETEDLLQERRSKRYLANQLHVITPFKDSKGNKIIIVLPTASNAAMQLFGLSRVPYRISKLVESVASGKVTVTDAIKTQITKALGEDVFVGVGKDEGLPVPRPMAEAIELLNPFIKEGLEQAFDYDLFMGRQITRGPDGSDKENSLDRLNHLGRVAFPPYQRLSGAKFKDPSLAVLDLLVGVVKAPDVQSWSDLKDDEQKFTREQRTIKNPKLKVLYDDARQSLFEEKRHAVYDFRVNGKRYGEALDAPQRIRVDDLLKQSKQGNGLSYSASAKFGLMGLIKTMDKAYEKPGLTTTQKARLDLMSVTMRRYLGALEAAQEKRLKSAIIAVKASPDPKTQGKIFKALTTGQAVPRIAEEKVLGGPVSFRKAIEK